MWFRPTTLAGVADAKGMHPHAKIVCGWTSQGVYGFDNENSVFINIAQVRASEDRLFF